MIIHCHHSHNPVSGEMKRIININNDVVASIDSDIIEVELYSIRYLKYVRNSGRFLLSPHIKKKYYIPNIPSLSILNDLYRILIMVFLFMRHKPEYYIEEWSLPRGINIIRKLFNKCKIGLDIHGAAPEEYIYINNKRSKSLEESERCSVLSADFIICQSNAMKEHLIKKYTLGTPIGVYRCAVDTNVFVYNDDVRRNIRQNLGYDDDDVVFVYSGGMHPWQKVEDAILIFSYFHSVNPKSKFLIITKEQDAFLSIITKINKNDLLSDITTVSLNYNDVPSYLCAADVSFLLRDNHIMNAVASPTKLAEYLSCGLPVISYEVSKNWVDKEGLKFILSIDNNITNKTNLITEFIAHSSRVQISKYAKSKLSLDIDKLNINSFIDKYLS